MLYLFRSGSLKVRHFENSRFRGGAARKRNDKLN
jgi:hypothetical protein